MVDTFLPVKRSSIMRAVKAKNTKLENVFRSALWKRGLRFRKHVKDLPGKPDIVFSRYRVAVFIDSCFWHGCPLHVRMPKSNIDYWERKIYRNKQRDEELNQKYKEIKWEVVRIWEHEIKEDFEKAVTKIQDILYKNTQ